MTVWWLHGVGIGVVARDGAGAAHLAPVTAILQHFGATPRAGSPALRLEVSCAEPPAVDGARPVARHLDMVLWRAGGALVVDGPRGVAHVGAAAATLFVAEPPRLPLVTCALFHLLRRLDLHPLHAAAVARDGKALLIVGPSGAGKSTLVTQLVQRGWGLVSDDSVLLRADPGGVGEVWALRRGLYLRPGEPPHLPGATFVPCPLIESVKQEVRLPGLRRVARATPAAVVLPAVASRDDTRLEPAEPEEVAHRLVAEARLVELDPSDADRHLGAALALVGRPAWRAALGRDVLTDPARVSDQLWERLDAAPAPPVARPFVGALRPVSPRPDGPLRVAAVGDGRVVVDLERRETWWLDRLAAWVLTDGDAATPAVAAALGLDAAAAAAWVAACRADLVAAGLAVGAPRADTLGSR